MTSQLRTGVKQNFLFWWEKSGFILHQPLMNIDNANSGRGLLVSATAVSSSARRFFASSPSDRSRREEIVSVLEFMLRLLC